jgi:hypothetical protein
METHMKRMQVLLVIVTLLFAIAVHAKTASEIFDAVSSSIVVIRTYDAKGKDQALGSGVVLASDVIATNCHVIKDAAKIHVVRQGQEYLATVRHSDWDRDVCTLTVSGINAPAVVTGTTNHLKVGARVYAIGAPKGLELTLSEGIISSLRPVEGGQYLQITAPISPGSSGGGLFDEEGRLVGLPTFYLSEGQQLNFAVPVEWISELPKRHKKEVEPEQTTTIDWLHKAGALTGKRDWAGLLAHSLRWTKAQPEMVAAWVLLGFAYGQSGQRAKEIESYQHVLRIDPENAYAWHLLGLAYRQSDQAGKAIESYQRVLRIDPENANAWFSLGEAYAKSDQTAKAIEAFRQAVRIEPKDPKHWYVLGLLYNAQGKKDQVMEVYKRLKTLDPAEADKFFNDVVLP